MKKASNSLPFSFYFAAMDGLNEQALLSFYKHLSEKASITEEGWTVLSPKLQVSEVKRNALVLEEGNTCAYIDFIYSGAFRSFYNSDGDEITVGLYLPGQCFTNLKSLNVEQPSQINIQSLGAGVIVRLRKADMMGLYERAPELETVGRKMLENMLVEENDWKEMYTLYNPEKRYEFMLKKSPDMIRVLPLQYIASFLGMRRETLSRIRSKVKL